jgi:hypothetical protein
VYINSRLRKVSYDEQGSVTSIHVHEKRSKIVLLDRVAANDVSQVNKYYLVAINGILTLRIVPALLTISDWSSSSFFPIFAQFAKLIFLNLI